MHKPTATLARRLSIGLGETRRHLGLSTRQTAALAGVGRTTVQNVERGDASAYSATRVALALIAYNMFGAPPEPEPVVRLPVLPSVVNDEIGDLIAGLRRSVAEMGEAA
jgi:transcriptional regulator with XRE-family HTH domain